MDKYGNRSLSYSSSASSSPSSSSSYGSQSENKEKKFNKDAYDPSWGAFQKYPTAKAIYERTRRAQEAEGFRKLNNAIGGPQRSYLETNMVAVKTIKALEHKERGLLKTLSQEREKNKSNIVNLYNLKCDKKNYK